MVPASTNLLVQPIVLVVGSGLLIWLLGYSAIVGVGVSHLDSVHHKLTCQIIVLAAAPVGTYFPIAHTWAAPQSHVDVTGKLFQMLLHNRQVQTKLMDKRIRLMAEVINSIRAVKLYAYESYMGQKVSAVREEEIVVLRAYGVLRSTVNALIEFIPIVASVSECKTQSLVKSLRSVTFVTYSLTGHSLEPSTIFPALQFFTVISGAISLFPPDVSQMLDAHVAIGALLRLVPLTKLQAVSMLCWW
jgi:ATP-binding cassette subfamily C (CFTR/MRP) protein 1